MKHDFQGCPMRCTRCNVPILNYNKNEECFYFQKMTRLEKIKQKEFKHGGERLTNGLDSEDILWLISQAEKVAIADAALELIGGTCGVPDASEACRIILKRVKEALKKIRE